MRALLRVEEGRWGGWGRSRPSLSSRGWAAGEEVEEAVAVAVAEAVAVAVVVEVVEAGAP